MAVPLLQRLTSAASSGIAASNILEKWEALCGVFTRAIASRTQTIVSTSIPVPKPMPIASPLSTSHKTMFNISEALETASANARFPAFFSVAGTAVFHLPSAGLKTLRMCRTAFLSRAHLLAQAMMERLPDVTALAQLEGKITMDPNVLRTGLICLAAFILGLSYIWVAVSLSRMSAKVARVRASVANTRRLSQDNLVVARIRAHMSPRFTQDNLGLSGFCEDFAEGIQHLSDRLDRFAETVEDPRSGDELPLEWPLRGLRGSLKLLHMRCRWLREVVSKDQQIVPLLDAFPSGGSRTHSVQATDKREEGLTVDSANVHKTLSNADHDAVADEEHTSTKSPEPSKSGSPSVASSGLKPAAIRRTKRYTPVVRYAVETYKMGETYGWDRGRIRRPTASK